MMKYESKKMVYVLYIIFGVLIYIMIIKVVGQTINYLGIMIKAAISLAIFLLFPLLILIVLTIIIRLFKKRW